MLKVGPYIINKFYVIANLQSWSSGNYSLSDSVLDSVSLSVSLSVSSSDELH